jgi:hypothetical protein
MRCECKVQGDLCVMVPEMNLVLPVCHFFNTSSATLACSAHVKLES